MKMSSFHWVISVFIALRERNSLYNVSSLRCVETCTVFWGFKLWVQGNVCNKILTDIYCWLSVFQKLHGCQWTSLLGILRKCGAGFTTIRSSLTSTVHETGLGNCFMCWWRGWGRNAAEPPYFSSPSKCHVNTTLILIKEPVSKEPIRELDRCFLELGDTNWYLTHE